MDLASVVPRLRGQGKARAAIERAGKTISFSNGRKSKANDHFYSSGVIQSLPENRGVL